MNIVCKELDKEFDNKEDLFKALKENKSTIIAQKKMSNKEADSINLNVEVLKSDVSKADDNSDVLKLSLVINTTNVMDSHSDVHLNGIWNKSLKEVKSLYLLQEHKMTFSNIITDNVTAKAKTMTFKYLGADFEGSTQALVFDVEIDKERNPFMFDQYSKGYVKNHSVGMRYVKIELAMNSDSKYDEAEKAVWDKYINEIANKEQAESQGYFWAVKEAKIIEGSAVPIGSNTITPVLNQKAASDSTLNNEPSIDTQSKRLLTELLNKFN